MTSNSDQITTRMVGRRIILSCAILLLVLVATLPLFCWLGYLANGAAGWNAVAVAGMSCGVGALSALLVTGMFQGANAVNGVLLGMLFRMAPPFAVVFAWTRSDVAMNANVLTTVVACYVLTLFAETLLSLRLISSERAAARAS